MGLRLYQAPVESDIPKSKSAVDRAVRSRTSAIRRTLLQNSEQIRERQRRIHEAFSVHNTFRGPSGLGSPTMPSATTDSNGMTSRARHGGRGMRDAAGRMPFYDDNMVEVSQRMAEHLHAVSNPSPLRDDDDDPSPTLAMAVEPEFLLRRNRVRPEPTYALSSMRSTQARNHPSRRATRPSPGTFSRRLGDTLRITLDEMSQESRTRQSDSSRMPSAFEPTHLDGLGDRNRSLSPEGDNGWETLLTTLTPDPQPPSVGSSFASASASAVASQGTAAASSRTSLTVPDTTHEPMFEHPCESGCDNSDTEGEGEGEDDELFMPQFTLSDYRALFRQDSTNDDPLELLGGIRGVQRMVRNLTERGDLSDEWWAEVGLTRIGSPESGSGN